MKRTICVVIMSANALILMAEPSQAFDQGSKISHEAVTPLDVAQAEQKKEQPPSGEIQERAVPRIPGMTTPSGRVMTAPALPPSRPGGTTGSGGSTATLLTSTECRNLGCQVVSTFNCGSTKACQCVKAICIDVDE